MKKIAAYILLLISATSFAQNAKVEVTAIKPAVTDFGKADGEKTEMKIGKEGGSFTSSDGKVRLLIPEGAISKKITFSIQPTTNPAPNGNGKSYQMEPSGINFPQPLQVIFYYTDNELQGNSAALLGIAMQDEKGRWSSLNKMKADTIAKTLTADIHHFSSYVNYLKAKIDPSSARVKVGGSIRLKITLVSPESVSSEDDDLMPLGVEIKNSPVWSVNGIPKGNSTIGLISVSQDYSAIYQAPAQIPEQNPVAVSVDFKGSSTNINERQFKSLKLVSNITIYGDAYEVKMVAAIIGGSPLAWGGVTTSRDEGSFVVSLEKNKPAVINIRNQMEVMTDNCQKIILNPNSNTGIFHVVGTRQIKITPANPPGQPYPIVELFFIPHPIELTMFKFICPPPPGIKESVKGKMDLSNAYSYMGLMMFKGKPAIPQYIKFIANDKEQIIFESPKDVREIYYKIWVRKIEE
jgi:hypothetical protein